ILTRQRIACTSVIVPIEVCGAVMRRTNDMQSARATRIQMQKWVQLGLLEIVELNRKRMQEAQELAIKHSIKGMDAIIAQVANEKPLPLLTFDKELLTKISGSIETITESEL
ncbi:MAG TPA: PIN domain-containing protein, partial [Nitrososphaerales archaeon]